MEYLVKLMPRAQRDLELIYLHINAVDSEQARLWYSGLRAAILNLSPMPNRNPVAPEKKRLRHVLYGKKPHIYRVIFRVSARTKMVEVLHIRHGARRQFINIDLE